MNKDDKIIIFGSNGLVGNAIARKLRSDGYTNIWCPDKARVNLTNQLDTDLYFSELSENDPIKYVFLAAAKVGGIHANNTQPADFGMINAQIELNVINACSKIKDVKLLFLGSSCIYPRLCKQPMKEEYLLESSLEKTNEMYALAKILGLKLCDAYRQQYGCNFISCMPTNLYGPNDNFNLENSHVLPALIRKIDAAKENNTTFEVWGDGSAMREFLYVDDLAEACIFLMHNYNQAGTINIGTGQDVTIKELVNTICKVIGYDPNKIVWDTSKPNGTPRKLLDVNRINDLGWKAKTSLEDGIKLTYDFYKNNPGLVRL